MGNQPIAAIEEAILPSAKDMLDQPIWWGEDQGQTGGSEGSLRLRTSV